MPMPVETHASDVTDIPNYPVDVIVHDAVLQGVTDVHIRIGHPILFRHSGRLGLAQSAVCPEGVMSEQMFASMIDTLHLQRGQIGYHVRRYAGLNERIQVRATYFPNFSGDSLILRIQALTPPRFADMVPFSCIIDEINHARGLILITGAIGSGKTTLAASVVEMLALNGRHIMTLEDPVEYQLAPTVGTVTQIDSSLSPEGKTPIGQNAFSFNESLALALRSDIQGLFIGECRTSIALRCALEFASAREPVITTLHSGGIPDAFIRMVTMATKEWGREVALSILAQTVHSVFEVSMKYTVDGTPNPLVSYMPFSCHSRLQKLVMEFDPHVLREQMEQEMNAGDLEEGFISPQRASEAANAREMALAVQP